MVQNWVDLEVDSEFGRAGTDWARKKVLGTAQVVASGVVFAPELVPEVEC